jgi:hypothetical protein
LLNPLASRGLSDLNLAGGEIAEGPGVQRQRTAHSGPQRASRQEPLSAVLPIERLLKRWPSRLGEPRDQAGRRLSSVCAQAKACPLHGPWCRSLFDRDLQRYVRLLAPPPGMHQSGSFSLPSGQRALEVEQSTVEQRWCLLRQLIASPLGTSLSAMRRLTVLISLGHPCDRRHPEPGKILPKDGRSPSSVTRSALARDLPRLHTGAPGGWPRSFSSRARRLIVAALSLCGGMRGRLARRRRRGPEGLRAAGGA